MIFQEVFKDIHVDQRMWKNHNGYTMDNSLILGISWNMQTFEM